MKSKLTLLTALAAATVLAAPALAQKSKDTLRIGFYQPVRLVDTYFQPGPEASLVTRMVFDNIVSYDPVKRKFVSQIAKSWKRLDPLTMEFTIRDDIKWHDGQPLTMDDIEYTYSFAMNPKVRYRFKATRVNWIDKFVRIDDKRFQVKSKQPMAVMMAKMTSFPAIYPKHVHGKLSIKDKNKFGKAAVGTGPYKAIKYNPSVGVRLVRNKNFVHGNAGKPAGTINNVFVRPIPDEQAQLAELLTGNIDLMYNMTRTTRSNWRRIPGSKSMSRIRFRFPISCSTSRADPVKRTLPTPKSAVRSCMVSTARICGTSSIRGLRGSSIRSAIPGFRAAIRPSKRRNIIRRWPSAF